MSRWCVLLGLLVLALAGCGAPSESDIQAAIAQTQEAGPSQTPHVVTATPVPPTKTPKPTRTPKASPTPDATATPRPTPTPTTPPAGGKWDIDISTSSFDDSQTVVLRLEAEHDVQGSVGRAWPALLLRCKEGVTDVYIAVGTQTDFIYGDFDRTLMGVRYDKDEAFDVKMDQSTDGEALFFPEPYGTIAAMLGHETMQIRFTPFNESPQETSFDLRGLEEHTPALAKACE